MIHSAKPLSGANSDVAFKQRVFTKRAAKLFLVCMMSVQAPPLLNEDSAG